MRIAIIALCVFCAASLAACGGDSSEQARATGTDVTIPPEIAADDDFQPFDTPPSLVHFQEPIYPASARRDGIEGMVMVKVVVGTDGGVVKATVLQSSHEMLSQSALEAARACTFTPGQLDGMPVQCAVAIPFKYALM
jgi:protein TonB